MLLNSVLCLLLVSNLCLSLAYQFPYLVRTYPKSFFSYNTIPAIKSGPIFTSINAFQKPNTIQSPTKKSDNTENLMFSDEQYLEQRKIDDRDDTSGDATSDLHPIYVLPPPNFQPIVYPISRSDPALLGAKALSPMGYPVKGQIPYQYPKGVSSWIFGGLTGIKRGNYWEQLSSDLALQTPVKTHHTKPVVVYLKRTPEQKGQAGKWPSFPIFEASSVVKSQTNTNKGKSKNKNPSNKNNNKGLRTKQAVGMTSFFLGGMRGVSGRHWQMPPHLVSQVEFMPNDNPIITSHKKKSTKPGVQFDDDNDFYNYNVIKDHK